MGRSGIPVLVVLLALFAGPTALGDEEGEEGYAPVFPAPIAFDPAAWETAPPVPSVADARARKGGRLVLATTDWPPTLRTEGPNARLAFTANLHNVVYETLLVFDPVDMRFGPNLATHWQVDEDLRTFRFRLDEEARWADGRDVTADDVVATVEHLQDPDRRDPMVSRFWGNLVARVRALDEHTVEIETRGAFWRNPILLGTGMLVYPAAHVRMDGETYLRDWNDKLPPGTGPYEIRPEDVKPGESITLRRRQDWWQKDRPENRGVANFDEIVWQVIPDQEKMYRAMLAGEIDMYRVGRASQWVNEIDREEPVRMGWVQKRKIYHRVPQGFGGFCFNLERAPFDDRNARLAFAHLFHRERLFAELLHDQYEYMDSYFPGQPWARPDAERVRYDPEKARALLRASGWTERDDDGILVNDEGECFPVLRLRYAAPSFGRIFEVVAQDLWNEAGIRMNLEVVEYAELLRAAWNREFQLVYWSWTASLFPDPAGQFHSVHADTPQTNNLNGFADTEADRLMDAYGAEWDPARRLELLQRLDARLFDAHLYALGWYAPFFRILYWDKFGHPPEYQAASTRDWLNVMRYWWYEPRRWVATLENRSLGRPNHPEAPGHQYDDVEAEWWRDNRRPLPR